jgi:signal transduction histidine kinase
MVRARLLPGESPADDLVVSAFQDITSLKRSETRLKVLAEASAILSESPEYQGTLQRMADVCVPELADWCVVDVLEWTRGVTRLAVAPTDPDGLALAQEVWRRWPTDHARAGAVHEMVARRRPLVFERVTDEVLMGVAQDDEHLTALRRLNIRSALIVPLPARGEVLGALTLVHSMSGRRFEQADVDLAADLGRRAGAAIDAARLVWETQENARLRDEFIAVASHDMRTPLAAVRGYAQLAARHLERAETPDRDQLARWLGDIDASVDRLGHLVSELLDATLVRAQGSVPLQVSSVPLSAVVDDVVERHRPLAASHRFRVEVEGDEPTGMWDASRLGRVLDNIVDNAVKYSPEGGAVGIRVGQVGELAYVAVTDEGIGIAPADREMIFNPMFRGNNAGGVAGTGLGLAGSRRLVELMGGTIEVESQLGQGSTFTVRLPLEPPGDPEASGL